MKMNQHQQVLEYPKLRNFSSAAAYGQAIMAYRAKIEALKLRPQAQMKSYGLDPNPLILSPQIYRAEQSLHDLNNQIKLIHQKQEEDNRQYEAYIKSISERTQKLKKEQKQCQVQFIKRIKQEGINYYKNMATNTTYQRTSLNDIRNSGQSFQQILRRIKQENANRNSAQTNRQQNIANHKMESQNTNGSLQLFSNAQQNQKQIIYVPQNRHQFEQAPYIKPNQIISGQNKSLLSSTSNSFFNKSNFQATKTNQPTQIDRLNIVGKQNQSPNIIKVPQPKNVFGQKYMPSKSQSVVPMLQEGAKIYGNNETVIYPFKRPANINISNQPENRNLFNHPSNTNIHNQTVNPIPKPSNTAKTSVFMRKSNEIQTLFPNKAQPVAQLFAQPLAQPIVQAFTHQNLFQSPQPSSFFSSPQQRPNLFSKPQAPSSMLATSLNTSMNIFPSKPSNNNNNEDKDEDDEDEDDDQEEGNYEELLQKEQEMTVDPKLSNGNFQYEQADVLFKEDANKFKMVNANVLIENVRVSFEKYPNSNNTLLILRLANKVISFTGLVLPGKTEITPIQKCPVFVLVKNILNIKGPQKQLQELRILFKTLEATDKFLEVAKQRLMIK